MNIEYEYGWLLNWTDRELQFSHWCMLEFGSINSMLWLFDKHLFELTCGCRIVMVEFFYVGVFSLDFLQEMVVFSL